MHLFYDYDYNSRNNKKAHTLVLHIVSRWNAITMSTINIVVLSSNGNHDCNISNPHND